MFKNTCSLMFCHVLKQIFCHVPEGIFCHDLLCFAIFRNTYFAMFHNLWPCYGTCIFPCFIIFCNTYSHFQSCYARFCHVPPCFRTHIPPNSAMFRHVSENILRQIPPYSKTHIMPCSIEFVGSGAPSAPIFLQLCTQIHINTNTQVTWYTYIYTISHVF